MARKRVLNSIICVVLAAVMSITMLPAKVQASDSKAVSGTTYKYAYKSAGAMNAGTYVKTKASETTHNSDWSKETTTYYCYKITVPENGFLKLSVTSSFNGQVFFFKTLSGCSTSKYARDNALVRTDYFDSSKRTQYLPMNRGTYYLCTPDNSSGGKIKFVFTKAGSFMNYCRAKASGLSANKTRMICFNEGYEHARWFKIKLTTKKTITVTIKGFDNNNKSFTVYDASGNEISCPQLDGDVYRTAKQAKGTYYIKINPPYYSWSARIVSLKWK